MWWPFKKKRHGSISETLQGFTDWHCHILPGVDDGVKTMEEALQILAEYERLGISEAWLTPHIMEDIPNTTDALRQRFAELQATYSGNVKLHLAAENMLDSLFDERLAARDLLPIGHNGDHLLVETSYFNPPYDLYGILHRIQVSGYHPILAHPERYTYMDDNDYIRLKSIGVKFQLNIYSLAYLYGHHTQHKAKKLLKKQLYNIMGTDNHSLNNFKKMSTQSLNKYEDYESLITTHNKL